MGPSLAAPGGRIQGLRRYPAAMDARESWREEKQSAHLYRVLADVEVDPRRRELFQRLGEAAESQALDWAGELDGAGGDFRPSLRVRLVARLIRLLGPRRVLPVLAAAKVRGLSVYRTAATAAGGGPVLEGHPMPTSLEDVEQQHRSTRKGGNLRAAVFGMNDGLVSNTCLLLGVAGADPTGSLYVLTGTAGLLAGACSMAAGEYVSVRTHRELQEHQIGLERAELERYPDEEARELALIYNARGLDMEEAGALARRLMRDPEAALETLTREELGLDPGSLGSPLGAAVSSFLAFATGALLPLLPFLLRVERGVPVMIALAGGSLFAVGATLSLFTGRGAVRSGLRMLGIGGAAGVLTWTLGALLGVSAG